MVKSGYKQTEIGVIPEDWEIATLTDVCYKNGIVRGPFGGSLKKEIFVTSGFKVYEQGNAIYKTIHRGKYYVDLNKYNEMLRFSVKEGDFIVSCSGTIGMIYQIPPNAPKGIINQALLKLTVDDSVIYPSFFYFYFSWEDFNRRITDDTQGGAIKNLVSMALFKRTWLLRPKIFEQKRIAEALSDTDNLINSLEKLIEKKKAIKQGAMQELLTGKTRLPGFTGEWNKNTLVNCAERVIVGLATSVTQYYREKGVPIFRNLNILPNKLDDSDILFLEPSFANDSPNKKIKANDVLTVHTGYVGASCLVPEKYDGALTFTTLITTTKREVLIPEYLMVHLNSALGKKMIELLQAGGGRNNLNVADFKQYEIEYPKNIDEQMAIVSILLDIDSEIEQLEQKLTKTRLIKQGMMQQLLTGKIRLV